MELEDPGEKLHLYPRGPQHWVHLGVAQEAFIDLFLNFLLCKISNVCESSKKI